jgi:hypothetical protein
MSVPGYTGIRKAQTIDHAVCLTDIMPTLLELAGIDIPKTVEGKSMIPLFKNERKSWREFVHIEHSPFFHCLTDGKERFFDLEKDPGECRDLSGEQKNSDRIVRWRKLLIEKLKDRPEGFTDGKKLISGCFYPPVI